jgi:hypothetical protein
MKNQLTVAIFVAVGATLVAGLIAIPVIEQSVLAKGPPEKAQAILAAEPKQRGSVASGGQGGGCNSCG